MSQSIAYPAFFHRELSPTWLSATLTALGYAAPSPDGARYLDIGCGSGFTLTLLAAANPSMQFVGIDPDPVHIATARTLVEAGGLGNIAFHQMGVGEYLATMTSGAGFDFIVSHGVYSWVDPQVRNDFQAAFARLLKRGGVASLHYMTQPGAAPFAAFHSVFRQMATGHGDDEKGMEAALDLLSALKQNGAGFFAAHPAAADTLAHLAKEDRGYIAHDYLGEHFHPLHVADVMADMSTAGLTYAGSGTPIENIDILSVPGKVLPLVQKESNPVLRETIKDMARNQAMRRDLYIRDPQPLAPRDHMAALRAWQFTILPGAPQAGPLTLDTRIGPVEAPADIVTPVLARLSQGPARFADLESLRPFAAQPGLLNQTLHLLMSAGIIHPLASLNGDSNPAERLNAVLLDRLRAGHAVPALVAPELGSAISL